MIGGQVDTRTFAAVRLLCCVVDHAPAGSDTAFHPGDALDDLDPLLVFEWQILLACDGETVDLDSGREVDGKSANLKIAIVADRGVIFAL